MGCGCGKTKKAVRSAVSRTARTLKRPLFWSDIDLLQNIRTRAANGYHNEADFKKKLNDILVRIRRQPVKGAPLVPKIEGLIANMGRISSTAFVQQIDDVIAAFSAVE